MQDKTQDNIQPARSHFRTCQVFQRVKPLVEMNCHPIPKQGGLLLRPLPYQLSTQFPCRFPDLPVVIDVYLGCLPNSNASSSPRGRPLSSLLLNAMLVVNPSDFLPQLVTYATFNIFATLALSALFVVTVIVQGFSGNSPLLNLEAIFILSSSTSSALIWTGHARDSHPPFALCLMNASAIMSNTPLMAGAALSVVIKVWGTAMVIWHPRFRPMLERMIWTPFLLLLPFVFAIPVFIAGIALGLDDRTKVFRGSPFYCVVDRDAIQIISSILGATFTLLALILATWTAVNILVTRRNVGRSRFTEDPHISYAFPLRVIVFSVFVGAAFVSGILALTSTFDALVPDLIVASCGVGAFFIFASARPIVRFVFLCRRDPRSFTPQTSWASRSWRSAPETLPSDPQEYILSSIVPGDRKPSAGFAYSQKHITRKEDTRADKVHWQLPL
ncbi:hypothetical protein C8R44DRAFT_814342 [Mycena epipterygia]|nr:hypothetical protein C8R44DRAFT_814342 [Mycena epipterygia]